MDEKTTLIVNSRISIPRSEFELSFARSSGPGGQNVNKVSSKATMRWTPGTSPSLPPEVLRRFMQRYGNKLTTAGELIITSQRYRDQGRNIEDCLEKLRLMVATAAVAPRPRKKTKPSRGSIERRLQAKREASQKKEGRKGEEW